ncbi:MAG: Ig-like domain-containing protein [Lachnospiraceae bacterium]|nr:Ig-like domain-containing protein [Lachnospiraceae bacterium]
MKDYLARYFSGKSAIKRVLALFVVVVLALTLVAPVDAYASAAKINKKSATIYVGSTTQLRLTGTKIKSVKTSKKTVATVSKAGKVAGKKAGKATITLTGTNKKEYKCKVTVKDTKINKTAISLEVGKKYQLKLTGTKIKSVKTSNKNIATVTKDGKVEGKKAGTATITLVGKNKKNHSCKVTVKEKKYTVKSLQITGMTGKDGTSAVTATIPLVGDTLTAVLDNKKASNQVTYQWYRGDAEISGATAANYTVTGDDKGAILSVKISTDNKNVIIYSSANSQETAHKVCQKLENITTELSKTTDARVEDTIEVTIRDGNTDLIAGTQVEIKWYRGEINEQNDRGADNENAYNVGVDDLGEPIICKLTGKPDMGYYGEVVLKTNDILPQALAP